MGRTGPYGHRDLLIILVGFKTKNKITLTDMYHLNINFGPLHFTTALIYGLAMNTNVYELWTVKRRQNMVPYFSLILYEYIVEFIQYFCLI